VPTNPSYAPTGDRARGDAGRDSDTDILVEFDPEAHVTVFDYAGVQAYIAKLFDVPVDVVDREALKPHAQESIVTDAVYAF
jgi:hypothetical protein